MGLLWFIMARIVWGLELDREAQFFLALDLFFCAVIFWRMYYYCLDADSMLNTQSFGIHFLINYKMGSFFAFIVWLTSLSLRLVVATGWLALGHRMVSISPSVSVGRPVRLQRPLALLARATKTELLSRESVDWCIPRRVCRWCPCLHWHFTSETRDTKNNQPLPAFFTRVRIGCLV